jgi:hypothetical protein
MKQQEPTGSIWWISTKDYFTNSNQTKQAHSPPLPKATEE